MYVFLWYKCTILQAMPAENQNKHHKGAKVLHSFICGSHSGPSASEPHFSWEHFVTKSSQIQSYEKGRNIYMMEFTGSKMNFPIPYHILSPGSTYAISTKTHQTLPIPSRRPSQRQSHENKMVHICSHLIVLPQSSTCFHPMSIAKPRLAEVRRVWLGSCHGEPKKGLWSWSPIRKHTNLSSASPRMTKGQKKQHICFGKGGLRRSNMIQKAKV